MYGQPITLTLTPTANMELALYAVNSMTMFDLSPAGWVNLGKSTWYSAPSMRLDGYYYPASGAALTATWQNPLSYARGFDAAGVIVKAAGGSAIATMTATNSGDVLAERMTLDFLGPVVNPQVVNATTGTSVSYTGTVASGKHLLVDTGASTALNDGANVIGAIDHAGAVPFLTLAPGANALSIYGSVPSGSPTLTVSFAPPWV